MKPSGEQLRIIADLIEAGKIKPVIERTFHLKMLKRRWNMRSQVEQREDHRKNEIAFMLYFSKV